jgi:hypothetical protein
MIEAAATAGIYLLLLARLRLRDGHAKVVTSSADIGFESVMGFF